MSTFGDTDATDYSVISILTNPFTCSRCKYDSQREMKVTQIQYNLTNFPSLTPVSSPATTNCAEDNSVFSNDSNETVDLTSIRQFPYFPAIYDHSAVYHDSTSSLLYLEERKTEKEVMQNDLHGKHLTLMEAVKVLKPFYTSIDEKMVPL